MNEEFSLHNWMSALFDARKAIACHLRQQFISGKHTLQSISPRFAASYGTSSGRETN
jgi:hypothetical protein